RQPRGLRTSDRPQPRSRLLLLLALALAMLGGWRLSAHLRHRSAGTGNAAGPAAAPSPGETAEQRLLDAAARQPTEPQIHQRLARFYTEQGRVAEAAWEYQEAAALRPDDL